ncbi:hypothetical protein Tco_1371391 [Tanacetum coccineum]
MRGVVWRHGVGCGDGVAMEVMDVRGNSGRWRCVVAAVVGMGVMVVWSGGCREVAAEVVATVVGMVWWRRDGYGGKVVRMMAMMWVTI